MAGKRDKGGTVQFPFRFLQPTFFAGLLDDPALLIRIRPLSRSLLFDCGQLQHVAKRTLKSIDAVFISHAHMDHFMGFDHVLRSVLITGRTLDVFGPPGLSQRMEHKLAAYDWNLAEDFWCTIRVHEVFPEHIQRCAFSGPNSFQRQTLDSQPLSSKEIFRNRYLRVEAEPVDHKIPSLMFRIHERNTFAVDCDKIRQAGLHPGPWLDDLKQLFYAERLSGSSVDALRLENGQPERCRIEDPAALYRSIHSSSPPASIGYLADTGFTRENQQKIIQFFHGISLLVSECTFFKAEVDRARASFHLTTQDVNQLLDVLRPMFVLPMHVSKTYSRRLAELYRELSPPEGVTLLTLPAHLPSAPLLPDQVPRPKEFLP